MLLNLSSICTQQKCFFFVKLKFGVIVRSVNLEHYSYGIRWWGKELFYLTFVFVKNQ